jgi:hypothetical protein
MLAMNAGVLHTRFHGLFVVARHKKPNPAVKQSADGGHAVTLRVSL